jgi:DNA-directed RNA polymerase sigma subunit (sigma70/sigma32)
VISLRYGFDGDPLTVRQVARHLGSREADVQEIEAKALERLAVRREVEALREAA